MIDRTARDQLAEAIRALSAGLISNDAFERRVPRSRDAAVSQVFSQGAWMLYSDLSEYRLKGRKRLPRERKSEVARWVLFLKTNQPYEWPYPQGILRFVFLLVVAVLTLGFSTQLLRRRWSQTGDLSVWPFIDKKHFNAALARPAYLSGGAGCASPE